MLMAALQYLQGNNMTMVSASLTSKVETQLKAQGFVLEGEYAKIGKMALAIAAAVVDEIQSNAEVAVISGSSAGTYKVT